MPTKPELQNQQQVSNLAKRADRFVYEFLRLDDGPAAASGLNYDMNSNATSTGSSKFSYTVPSGEVFVFSRINFCITDGSINPGDFGGINGGLPSGSSLQIIGLDGSVLKDFHGNVPIQTNDDLYSIAGIDAPITALAGDDALPVRFSLFKAGNMMELQGGERIRWTNRDNLSAMTKFRGMVQGTLK